MAGKFVGKNVRSGVNGLKQTEMKVRGIIFLSDFYAPSKVDKNPFNFYQQNL